LCLEPHDLAIAKYAAAREKDLIFTRELVRRGIVAEERLLLLLDQTQVDEEVRNRIRDQIAADFQAARDRDSIREREPAITQQSVAALSGGDELEAIKAR
jgi:predicted transcriptional regulator